MKTLHDKCRGSLVGGAVGDALGYEVEFMTLDAIRKRFGKKGISDYVLHHGVAEFSDDTQMTLFTAEGLLNGVTKSGSVHPRFLHDAIKEAYLNWYKTQTEIPHPIPGSKLADIRSLWSRRAPGMTCMGSLQALAENRDSKNNSKGCGGVMRVAPVGIFFAANTDMSLPEEWEPTELMVTIASNAAFITHGHMASCYSAALLALIVNNCICFDAPMKKENFKFIVRSGLNACYEHLPLDSCWLDFKALIEKAMTLAEEKISDTEAIRQIGEGWVGDEAIAIAIYSVMRHIDSFEKCVVCAVNHDGDSDSTGTIAGNIIGAIHGYDAIPKKYKTDLELHDHLLAVADQLIRL